MHELSDPRQGQLAELQARTRELERALEQKTALLHEVDHRVKNNLQLISSLLLLQSRRIEDESARRALKGMLERVSAIAAVHRRLSHGHDIERFDVAEFVRDLAADLAATAGRSGVLIRLDLEQVAVPAAQAAPLALVINELLGNAIKHAFPAQRPGVITISIARRNGEFDLTVADDGVGIPVAGPTKGFGTTIIQLLCQQLRAQIRVEEAQPGVRTVVTLPVHIAASPASPAPVN
jgi:two-component sensor histidine kinase